MLTARTKRSIAQTDGQIGAGCHAQYRNLATTVTAMWQDWDPKLYPLGRQLEFNPTVHDMVDL